MINHLTALMNMSYLHQQKVQTNTVVVLPAVPTKKTTPTKLYISQLEPQYNGGDSSSRMDDNETQRHQELELLEQDEGYKNAKQDWKSLNPDQNIKFWKDQYIKGKIDELPWVSYVQNSEQSPNSLWNRIRSKDE